MNGISLDTYKHLDDDDYGQFTTRLKMPEVAERICKLNYGAHRLLSAMVHELRKRNDHFLTTTERPELHEKESPLAAELERILNAGFYY